MATSEDFTIEGGTWLEIWDLAAQRRESASPATVLPSLA